MGIKLDLAEGILQKEGKYCSIKIDYYTVNNIRDPFVR